jgi:hypothetical protein
MKLLVSAVLMAVTMTANATDRGNPLQGSSANASAIGVGVGVGVGNGGAGGNVGNITPSQSVNVPAPDYGDMRIVPSAIAPSVNTGVICPMVMQGSKAGSVFFFSGSGTHAPDIVPICVAWHLKQMDVVEKMTCAASKEYAKANPNCKEK